MSTAVATATPTTLPPNPSPNLTTILKFMNAANSCDVDGMLAVLSDTSFGHELAPENYIKQSGFSVVRNGKEEFKDGIAKVLGLLKSPGVRCFLVSVLIFFIDKTCFIAGHSRSYRVGNQNSGSCTKCPF